MLLRIKRAAVLTLTVCLTAPFAFAADEKVNGKDGQNNQKDDGQRNQNGNDKKPAM